MFGQKEKGLFPVEGMLHHDGEGNVYQVMRDNSFNFFVNGRPLREIATEGSPERSADFEDCMLIIDNLQRFREINMAA